MSCIWSIVKILEELKLSSASTINHLIDFGVCALVGCTNFIILHNYFKDILSAFLGVQI